MVGLMTPIAENLKRLRTAAGLTQQEVAVAAGLNASIVAQIEQGRNLDPRMGTLRALARSLGVKMDELVNGPEDDPPAAAAKKARGKKRPAAGGGEQ